MTVNPTELLRAYKNGLDFKRNDVLRPKRGANPWTAGTVDATVIVLEQDTLVPHEYTVVGERAEYSKPHDRFVKFVINGHDWEKAGKANA